MTVNTHQQRYGSKFEWLTPPWVFEALGVEFDLDPCSPMDRSTFVPARHVFTQNDDGLAKDWFGCVWMNPPFGTANGVHAWLHRFFSHGNGIGIIRADTSTSWWHQYVSQSSAVIFPKGRVRYINNNPGQEKAKGGPGFASAIFSAGQPCGEILAERGHKIGIVWQSVGQGK